MGLYERLQKELHGATPNDIAPIVTWVKKIEQTGVIAGWQMIALILYDREASEDCSNEENRHFVLKWEELLLQLGSTRYPITGRPIRPRDRISLLELPLNKAKLNIDWVLPIDEADDLFDRLGFGPISESVKRWCDWVREGDTQIPVSASTIPENLPVEEKPRSTREINSLLRIIGALLELVQNHRPGRDSEAAVIRELVENYSDKEGISKPTLEKRFAQAKRVLNALVRVSITLTRVISQ